MLLLLLQLCAGQGTLLQATGVWVTASAATSVCLHPLQNATAAAVLGTTAEGPGGSYVRKRAPGCMRCVT